MQFSSFFLTPDGRGLPRKMLEFITQKFFYVLPTPHRWTGSIRPWSRSTKLQQTRWSLKRHHALSLSLHFCSLSWYSYKREALSLALSLVSLYPHFFSISHTNTHTKSSNRHSLKENDPNDTARYCPFLSISLLFTLCILKTIRKETYYDHSDELSFSFSLFFFSLSFKEIHTLYMI